MAGCTGVGESTGAGAVPPKARALERLADERTSAPAPDSEAPSAGTAAGPDRTMTRDTHPRDDRQDQPTAAPTSRLPRPIRTRTISSAEFMPERSVAPDPPGVYSRRARPALDDRSVAARCRPPAWSSRCSRSTSDETIAFDPALLGTWMGERRGHDGGRSSGPNGTRTT